jgi:hypothetical protein
MKQEFRLEVVGEYGPLAGGPSEPESFVEHQAALDATIFRPDSAATELVLELEAGQLRFRTPS